MPADFLVLPYQRNHARFSVMGINSCGCWVLAFLTNNNILLGVTKVKYHNIYLKFISKRPMWIKESPELRMSPCRSEGIEIQNNRKFIALTW